MTTQTAPQTSNWKAFNQPETALINNEEQSFHLDVEDDPKWGNDSSIDLNGSGSLFDTQKTSASSSADQNRNELKEIQQFAAKETAWIRMWRLLTTLVLLATASVVTITTYRFLQEEQKKSFEQAVSLRETSPRVSGAVNTELTQLRLFG